MVKPASRGLFIFHLLSLVLFSASFSCKNKFVPNDNIDSSFWLKPSSGIRGLLEDSKGNLWIGTTDFICMVEPGPNGILGPGNKITYFDEVDEMCGIRSYRIQEDHNGNIWVQSGPRVCSYDGNEFHSYTVDSPLSAGNWASSPNDLWFKNEVNGVPNPEAPPGVFRYHNEEFTFLALPVPLSKNANQIYNWMTNVVKGSDGTIWFGTMGALIGYHPFSTDDQEQFTVIGREEMGRQDDSRHVGIRGICEDSKGNIWMADNGSGAFVFNGDTTINFTRKYNLDSDQADGNSLHRTFCVNEDNEGNMWFGTVYSGIWRFNPDTEEFSNFTDKNGVKSESFWTIYKTKKGELLFAGEGPGAVYAFNGASFERIF